MTDIIIVKLEKDETKTNSIHPYTPVIIHSTHPRYRVGTRFDYVFMHIALGQGYSVLLIGTSKEETQ